LAIAVSRVEISVLKSNISNFSAQKKDRVEADRRLTAGRKRPIQRLYIPGGTHLYFHNFDACS
jgi:hypothetical protein